MKPGEATSDAELLSATATCPEAYGIFYRRHVTALLRFLTWRTGRAELAADLCAEVFAVALEQCDRYDPERAPARSWLFAIASSRLRDSFRRGQVEDRARRRLGMPARDLTDADIERVEELIDAGRGLGVERLVEDLPEEQREAVRARVVDERDYSDIAGELKVSQAVVRQRVSRGLATLRSQLTEGEER